MVADYLAVCRNGVGLITIFISCSTSKKLNNIQKKWFQGLILAGKRIIQIDAINNAVMYNVNMYNNHVWPLEKKRCAESRHFL